MAYQGAPNLGEIYGQAQAIQGQKQRSKLADLAIAAQEKNVTDQQGIDTALANPNATLPDLQKFGTQGIQAYQQLSQAQAADLTNHYREIFRAADAVANSDNPAAVVAQVAPQFAQQYDQTHGPGAFAKLAQDPAALKQQAAALRDQALSGLVDPDKQFQAHQAMLLEHQRQMGPGGELVRNQNTIAAENARAAAQRAVTMRGQDLENARGSKPQLVEVPNADGTVTKKWLIPGQLEGPTVGTSPPGAKLTETQGNAKAFGLRAQNANAALEAMLSGPQAYDPTGMGGTKDLLTAGGVLTNRLASSQGQQYQNLAKAFIAPILRKESGAAISKDEWTQARQLYIPGPNDDAAVLAQKAQNRKDAIEGLRVQAGPTGLPEARGASTSAGGLPPNIAALLDKYK
jgi:hypothetical protein